ncbi:Protein F46H5.7 a [Aphelenchoides avenae]|nr:Protein F46H5.7 a [Aphelenchus avenae]
MPTNVHRLVKVYFDFSIEITDSCTSPKGDNTALMKWKREGAKKLHCVAATIMRLFLNIVGAVQFARVGIFRHRDAVANDATNGDRPEARPATNLNRYARGTVPVNAWLQAPSGGASEVLLIGSFTDWEHSLHCQPDGRGNFGIFVELPPGRHEFRFKRDDRWFTPDHYAKVRNRFGSENNIIVIS